MKLFFVLILLSGTCFAMDAIAPDFSEFYTDYTIQYSGWGSKKKNSEVVRQVNDYWANRRTAFNLEIESCDASADKASCYLQVRQLEFQKTEAYKSNVNAMINASQIDALRRQAAWNSVSQSMQQASQQLQQQNQYRRPLSLNCNTFGNYTNCTGY